MNNKKLNEQDIEININELDDERDSMMEVVNSNLGFISDIGRKKTENQDYAKVGLREDGVIIMVLADGVTRSEYSGESAKFSCEYLFEKLNKKNSYNKEYILNSINELNDEVIKKQNEFKKPNAFFTTLVVAMIKENEMIISWVGDSRAYFVNSEKGLLLTRDDSYVNNLINKGKISAEEARFHPQKNIITQCIGVRENEYKNFGLSINIAVYRIPEKTSVLICSDGLWSEVNLLEGIDYKDTIDMTLLTLIKKANKMGGNDNITLSLYMNK